MPALGCRASANTPRQPTSRSARLMSARSDKASGEVEGTRNEGAAPYSTPLHGNRPCEVPAILRPVRDSHRGAVPEKGAGDEVLVSGSRGGQKAAIQGRPTSSAGSVLGPGNLAQQSHQRFLELLVQGRRIDAPEASEPHHAILVRDSNIRGVGLLDLERSPV